MDTVASFDLPDLEEDQPKGSSVAIPWLVVASLALLFLSLYQVAVGIGREVAYLQGEVEPIHAAMTRLSTPQPEVVELGERLAEAEAAIGAIDSVRPTIAANHVNWSAVAGAIASYDPTSIALTALTDDRGNAAIKGTATDDWAVASYARSLESSGLFNKVVVQTIRAVATPAAQASARQTATPTSMAGSATVEFVILVMPKAGQ